MSCEKILIGICFVVHILFNTLNSIRANIILIIGWVSKFLLCNIKVEYIKPGLDLNKILKYLDSFEMLMICVDSFQQTPSHASVPPLMYQSVTLGRIGRYTESWARTR